MTGALFYVAFFGSAYLALTQMERAWKRCSKQNLQLLIRGARSSVPGAPPPPLEDV
jgi:hypothetical protein